MKRHSEYSGQDLSYYDDETKERFIPWDIECSGGVDRAVLFVLLEAYMEDEFGGPASAEASAGKELRVFLKLNPKIAPIKVAVFPLLKNKPDLVAKAKEVYGALTKKKKLYIMESCCLTICVLCVGPISRMNTCLSRIS